MRNWEDIVKDKLEEPDGTLPESVFAEFQARRSGAAPAPATKRSPLVWVVATAVAAGLAAILLLRKPSVPEESIRIVPQPVPAVAVVTDSTAVEAEEPLPVRPLIAQAPAPKAAAPKVDEPKADEPEVGEPEIVEPEAVRPEVAEPAEEPTVAEPAVATASPFIPQDTPARSVDLHIAPAAGIVAGGGLLAALLAPLARTGDSMPEQASINYTDPIYGNQVENIPMSSDEVGHFTHAFPFKAGLSVGIPVAEKLRITTGLEYILYQTRVSYTHSGEKKQAAHYLGIPLRLDWTLASNRWLDVYVGGGVSGDWCLGATLAGKEIPRDGFSFSLLGAGGVQFNMTRRLGLYVEPEISWTFPSEKRVLETYRSAHPFLFSVATGLRINL
jgi:opacity protein-like surface antigen